MLDLAQGQVFVTTVPSSWTAALWITTAFLVLGFVLLFALIETVGKSSKSTVRGILVGMGVAFGSAGLLISLGAADKIAYFDNPRGYEQVTAVPATQLRERYGLERDVLPDGMTVDQDRELVSPGVYLVRELGTYRGAAGVFWSLDFENSQHSPGGSGPGRGLTVLDGPSVVRDH